MTASTNIHIDEIRIREELEESNKNVQDSNWKDLFQNYLNVTILLWVIYFCTYLDNLMNLLTLPMIFKKDDPKLWLASYSNKF